MTHISTTKLMGRLWREHIRTYAGWLILAVTFMAVVAACTTFSAYLMKPIVNDIFVNRDEDMLWLIGGSVFIVFIVKGIATYAQQVLMSKVGMRIVADLQNRLYRHLTDLDISFFHANATGTLVSRFTVDITSMRVAVSHAITVFGKDMLSLIGLVGNMFWQDWQLALIAIFVFPVAISPIAKIGRRMRKVTVNSQVETGQLMTTLEQTFQGIRMVKAYSMEGYERGRVDTLVEKLFGLSYKGARTRALSSPIMETLGGVAIGIIIIYGGFRVIQDATDPGSFFSFITALLLAYEPMKRLANLNATVQEGLAGAQRTYKVLDHVSRIQETEGAATLNVSGGKIQLENVSFSYPKSDEDGFHETALDNINITIPAGKTVALVGTSGAGKSTIMNLVPRFYDVTDGKVLIDDQNIRDVTFESLRNAIALVSQEVTLFDDTVRANIGYGRKGASFEDIQDAARHAAAHDFIQELPEGYDTMVGEHGVRLSGGQRQRLAIARAMLKNAPILLLDEATSALDTESERHVQTALEELMANRTTLVIAHRLSTVVDADLIIVLSQGRVVEQGSHDELLEKGGQYANLYQLQFAEDATEQALEI
ncbi:lipid A export permease/ATP-binding protein MsbA [Magnetovibrio sp. PR-2]|uniref:lipid A export permease/ATP-binding protein MsbA n=1 Tax=Magnetovibrio sp. PR-2 TaxID=3120356 RepID=UPI002FCE63CB